MNPHAQSRPQPRPHPLPAGWLMAFHDGELDDDRRAQVTAHLAACAACRQELAELDALRVALAADALPAGNRADEFWGRVQAQLPERLPAPAPARPSARQALLRWLPGIGLLLLNGALQVLAVALTALLLLPMFLSQAPAWVNSLAQLGLGASLGWLAWLVPAGWGGWALLAVWLIASANLALLYLAWLGYEIRHGPFATFARAAAG